MADVSSRPRDFTRDYPSLEHSPDGPHGWIQWKGTEVCMDVHCACGAHGHFDGDFCYHVKCAACGQVYEVGGHVTFYPLDHEPPDTKRVCGDEDEEDEEEDEDDG